MRRQQKANLGQLDQKIGRAERVLIFLNLKGTGFLSREQLVPWGRCSAVSKIMDIWVLLIPTMRVAKNLCRRNRGHRHVSIFGSFLEIPVGPQQGLLF